MVVVRQVVVCRPKTSLAKQGGIVGCFLRVPLFASTGIHASPGGGCVFRLIVACSGCRALRQF